MSLGLKKKTGVSAAMSDRVPTNTMDMDNNSKCYEFFLGMGINSQWERAQLNRLIVIKLLTKNFTVEVKCDRIQTRKRGNYNLVSIRWRFFVVYISHACKMLFYFGLREGERAGWRRRWREKLFLYFSNLNVSSPFFFSLLLLLQNYFYFSNA